MSEPNNFNTLDGQMVFDNKKTMVLKKTLWCTYPICKDLGPQKLRNHIPNYFKTFFCKLSFYYTFYVVHFFKCFAIDSWFTFTCFLNAIIQLLLKLKTRPFFNLVLWLKIVKNIGLL
jgi:hypothetical protein